MAAGDLRLDKTGATAYRLTIHKLQPVDQGLLYCQAAEWIQDPDGSWFAMTRKQSDKTQLRIQPTGEWIVNGLLLKKNITFAYTVQLSFSSLTEPFISG